MSRTKRWAEAVTAAQTASAELRSALEELQSVHDEYTEWHENLPENLEFSALGEKLTEVAENIEAQEATSYLDDIDAVLDAAEGVDLPIGFGRD